MKLLLFTLSLFPCVWSYCCTGGTSAGTLTPTAAYQTISTLNGQYYTVSVNKCDVYEFSFCNGGGTSGYDTQLTILDATGATQILYADDICGSNASLTYTAGFTGTIRVLISKYNCVHDMTSSGTLAYKVTANVGGYCLGGNASYQTIGGQSCIQLTPETNAQTGCAWNNTVIDFNQPFNLTLNYYFGNNINGADGTTFTFQPNPAACGTAGAQLGAGGIANSLIIEFDTYDNDNPTHLYDMLYDHIAVEIDGNLQGPGAPYCGPVSAFASNANLDDGVVHQITINWVPGTTTLSVYVDGALRLSCVGNFISTVFGGDPTVYWGATAATGGLNNQQYFCPNTVVLPVELSKFNAYCEGDVERIYWVSESEHRLSTYTLEYTIDGMLYYPLSTQAAVGESQNQQTYSYVNSQIRKEDYYYRLKMTDEDGSIKYSDLIKSNNCGYKPTTLVDAITNIDGGVHLKLNEKHLQFQLLDVNGKAITDVIENGENTDVNLYFDVQQAMYLVRVFNTRNNTIEIHKFFRGVNQ